MKEILNDPTILIRIKWLNNELELPKRATPGAAGFDLCSAEDTISIRRGFNTLIGCGFSIDIPYGYYALILPRSGLASKGVYILNSPGLIDSDYRGEVKVMLGVHEFSSNVSFTVYKGDRIAQMIIGQNVMPTRFEVVDNLSITERGEKGFGSTGL